MLFLPNDDLPELGGEVIFGLLCLGLQGIELVPPVDPQLNLLLLPLDYRAHPKAGSSQTEFELEIAGSVLLGTAAAATCGESRRLLIGRLGEDDMVVVDEDVSPLTLVPVEKNLGLTLVL